MRETIQTKLNEVSNVDSGVFIPDAVIEVGTTYFGYEIQDNFSGSTLDQNDNKRITLIGFLVRKNKYTENTLQIIDTATEDIINKLKELNFKVSSEDISLQSDVVKKKITAYAYLQNNTFIR